MILSHKAANGEGTIIKLPNGKWRAAIFVPIHSGEKKRKYHVTQTQREARDWLTQMRADIQVGKPVLTSNMTFIEYLEHWYEQYGSIFIRDSTKMNYLGYIKHVKRHKIKYIPLKNISTDDLQDFIIFLRDAGHLDTATPLSAKTLRNIINMIHKALQHAVGRQLLYHNPADFVQLPKVKQPEIRVLTEDEISKFVAAMNGDPLQIALILMVFCGLRLGECCALTHDDVRCTDGIYYLNVSKSLNRVTNFEAKERESKTILRISETKSNKSNRQVPMLPEVADKLLTHLAQQKEQSAKSYGLYEKNPFLVSNEMGHYLDPGTVRKKLKAIAKSIGFEGFHPHCLRHTYASQAVKAGVPLPYLSDCLGHESTAFTAKVYVSLDLEGRSKALSSMSKLVKNTLRI